VRQRWEEKYRHGPSIGKKESAKEEYEKEDGRLVQKKLIVLPSGLPSAAVTHRRVQQQPLASREQTARVARGPELA
jgi:hypothetical protein